MPRLAHPRREALAQAMATFGDEEAALRSMSPPMEDGARLLQQPDVLIRIEELRQENEALCVLRRREVLEFLTRVVRTPAAQVTPDSPLAEEIHAYGGTLVARMPSKLEALALASWLCGWGGPAIVPSPALAQRALDGASPSLAA